MKCYEITPSPDPAYNSMIVEAGETWAPALKLIESALDDQFVRAENEGRPWTDITVTVRCVNKTQDEINTLCE